MPGDEMDPRNQINLPRLELPPPDVLPLFEIGAGKSGWEDAHMGEYSVVMNDFSLVCMCGEAYCVEFRCNRGNSVKIYHLDKQG